MQIKYGCMVLAAQQAPVYHLPAMLNAVVCVLQVRGLPCRCLAC
jgi:hypothetical protein